MEGNRDESEKCIKIAFKLAASGEKEKAIKFLQKADKLYPSQKAKDLLNDLQMSNGSAASGHDDRSGASSGSSPNGSPAGAAGSTESEEPNLRQRRGSGGREKAELKESSYTPDQLEYVKRVRKCKDYYEILGVTKDCTDDDLKKAYRKLAMKLHPDKNHAPGATEAFKAISNAFGVLSDSTKRQRYDQFGAEDNVARSRHSHGEHYDYTRGFEGDISAEELFNMFFGGAFPSDSEVYVVNGRFVFKKRRRSSKQQRGKPQASDSDKGNVYTRRHHMHRTYSHHHHRGETQNEPAYTLLLQLAPILFLVLLSLLSSFLVSDPPYSLTKTERYHIMRKTSNLNVPYYVKPDFSVDYRGSMRRLEQQIEDEYISNLRSNCFRERSYKENMLWRARNFNDHKLHEKAQHLKTPSCEALQSIYS